MTPEEAIMNLIDEKIVMILSELFRNQKKIFNIKELAKESKVSLSSTFRIILKLKSLNIVSEEKLNTFKAYTLAQNEVVSKLKKLILVDNMGIHSFIDKASKIENINEIILQNKSEDKANVIIIGENINSEEIKKTIYFIKEKYDFVINYLIIQKDQYKQMQEMGLYPHNLKKLFVKEKTTEL